MNVVSLIIAIVAAVAVLLIVYAVAAPPQSDAEMLESRLAQFAESGRALTSLTEAEMTLPFFDRVIRPMFDKLSSRLNARLSQSNAQQLQDQINLAGKPAGLTAGGFVALQMICVVIGGVIGTLLAILASIFLLPIVGLMIGFLGPRMWLQRRVKGRQKEILLGLPSALDLLTISVEAGLGFDAALARVTDKYKNALALEFNQVLNEIRLGRPRLEALEDLGRRCQVDELTNFVQAIIQSDQLGVGVANVLRIQSEEIRRRRRQRAEEAGQKAPLKMLFPMVGCIFPTLFIVLLGPAAAKLLGGG